jgi:hypothetical protein
MLPVALVGLFSGSVQYKNEDLENPHPIHVVFGYRRMVSPGRLSLIVTGFSEFGVSRMGQQGVMCRCITGLNTPMCSFVCIPQGIQENPTEVSLWVSLPWCATA